MLTLQAESGINDLHNKRPEDPSDGIRKLVYPDKGFIQMRIIQI